MSCENKIKIDENLTENEKSVLYCDNGDENKLKRRKRSLKPIVSKKPPSGYILMPNGDERFGCAKEFFDCLNLGENNCLLEYLLF